MQEFILHSLLRNPALEVYVLMGTFDNLNTGTEYSIEDEAIVQLDRIAYRDDIRRVFFLPKGNPTGAYEHEVFSWRSDRDGSYSYNGLKYRPINHVTYTNGGYGLYKVERENKPVLNIKNTDAIRLFNTYKLKYTLAANPTEVKRSNLFTKLFNRTVKKIDDNPSPAKRNVNYFNEVSNLCKNTINVIFPSCCDVVEEEILMVEVPNDLQPSAPEESGSEEAKSGDESIPSEDSINTSMRGSDNGHSEPDIALPPIYSAVEDCVHEMIVAVSSQLTETLPQVYGEVISHPELEECKQESVEDALAQRIIASAIESTKQLSYRPLLIMPKKLKSKNLVHSLYRHVIERFENWYSDGFESKNGLLQEKEGVKTKLARSYSNLKSKFASKPVLVENSEPSSLERFLKSICCCCYSDTVIMGEQDLTLSASCYTMCCYTCCDKPLSSIIRDECIGGCSSSCFHHQEVKALDAMYPSFMTRLSGWVLRKAPQDLEVEYIPNDLIKPSDDSNWRVKFSWWLRFNSRVPRYHCRPGYFTKEGYTIGFYNFDKSDANFVFDGEDFESLYAQTSMESGVDLTLYSRYGEFDVLQFVLASNPKRNILINCVVALIPLDNYDWVFVEEPVLKGVLDGVNELIVNVINDYRVPQFLTEKVFPIGSVSDSVAKCANIPGVAKARKVWVNYMLTAITKNSRASNIGALRLYMISYLQYKAQLAITDDNYEAVNESFNLAYMMHTRVSTFSDKSVENVLG